LTLLFLIFFCVLIQVGNSPAAQTEKKGRIQGEDFVNLRSGPGIEYAPRAVLKRGDEVTVNAEERGWYLVSLGDQKTGYVSREFVDLSGSSETKEISQAKPAMIMPEEKKEEGEEEREEKTLAPRQENNPASQGKPWPVVRAIEGREWEIFRWLLAALCIFIIGWICGGNYYLRRDRAKRTKLHF
jgi:uncharacterized protein YgiM (DUF1202 family)